MAELKLNILKSAVLNEVYKQTAYVGAKITQSDGTNAYDKIYATADDAAMMERFWKEAIAFTTGNIKLYLKSCKTKVLNGTEEEIETSPAEAPAALTLEIILTMPEGRYNASQNNSIVVSLYSYFVNYMTARWMAITNKPEAEYYEKYAQTSMEDVMRKVFSKTRPAKPATTQAP